MLQARRSPLNIPVTRACLNQTEITSYQRKCHLVLAFQSISAGRALGTLTYVYANRLHAVQGRNTVYQSKEILPPIKTYPFNPKNG
jgi:hypothetical protein